MTAARVAALAALALALAACGSSGKTSTTTTTASTATTAPSPSTPVLLRVTVGSKGVPGGPKRLSLKQGAKAVLVVHSALADEVHFHGYDLAKDVAAGGTARIPFTASIPGLFEVELESRKLPIAEIEVTP
jgi:hypothetical protein